MGKLEDHLIILSVICDANSPDYEAGVKTGQRAERGTRIQFYFTKCYFSPQNVSPVLQTRGEGGDCNDVTTSVAEQCCIEAGG